MLGAAPWARKESRRRLDAVERLRTALRCLPNDWPVPPPFGLAGAAGSTLLTVHGSGFLDMGGLYCHFGDRLPLSPATLRDAATLLCRSPPLEGYLSPPAPPAAPPSSPSNATFPPSPLPPPPPPLGAVPLRVVLNGDPATAAAGPSVDFTFTSEPCEGEVSLSWPAGTFTDGLLGTEEYTAARNCSWRVMHSAGGGALLLTLTHVWLRPGHDTMTVYELGEGEGEDGGGGDRLLRALPLAVGDSMGSYGCGPADGACLETIVIRRPPARVHFYQAPAYTQCACSVHAALHPGHALQCVHFRRCLSS